MAPTTRRGPNTPVNDTNPNNMTPESIQAMIDQALLRNSTNGDGSHSSHGDNRRNVQTVRPCFYADFMKCQPLNFKGTEGVVGLTRWIEKMESVFNISGCAIENQVKFATCTLLGAAFEFIHCTFPRVNFSYVPKFVANETEKVDKYISGLPDNIYGNVKQSDNKRKADDSSRNNHGHQQQPFKRQNVAKVYNMGTGERKPYGGSLPKNTGNTNVANTQKGNGAARKGNGCFECGAPGHFKRYYPKLKNKDGGNGNAQGWVYAVGNAEKRGNAPGNPDANVVTGTFLLNNHYASILFDTGADRSFISTAFSSLINIAPTSLENCYDVELADGKLVEINTIIRGCTLNFLGHPIMPPQRVKKKSVKRLVEKRVAKAIEEYEKTRANPNNAGGSGTTNAGGTVNVQGCSHKTFMNGKPHSFNGTEGVVGLRRWIEKVEQVFEICKCAEEDKVMFAASTFEGRALTW
ncbi:putative reverse transcriptase domain-containing protein [Tanacetum coccineum]